MMELTVSEGVLLERLVERMRDRMWRLSHLYWIRDKQGAMVRFRPNWAQRRFVEGLHTRNNVLKCRQLGISTVSELLILDRCLMVGGSDCGINDKTLPDAKEKLEKVRFAWCHLDYLPRNATAEERVVAELGRRLKERTGVPARDGLRLPVDNAQRIGFANGSSVRVGTSIRGGTLAILHVSELAHVSVVSPDKAEEIRTGSMNAVALDRWIINESTHEGGKYGVNWEICKASIDNLGKEGLNPLDYKFFFFPWFENPEYELPCPEGMRFTGKMADYFASLEAKGIVLSAAKKNWYASMQQTMGVYMRQEYPSTVDEAFMVNCENAIYGAEMMELATRGMVGVVFEWDRGFPLYTAWDIGRGDLTAIWLLQVLPNRIDVLDFYQGNASEAAFFARVVQQWEARYAPVYQHFVPHDAQNGDYGGGSFAVHLMRAGVGNLVRVPRVPDVWLGINALRMLLPQMRFHVNTTVSVVHKGKELPSGVDCMGMYRTAPVGVNGILRDEPLHDVNSHAADALRQFAQAWDRGMVGFASGVGMVPGDGFGGKGRGRRAIMD